MLLMIDNYDSFTFNLVQYFAELGEDVRVFRNDELTLEGISELRPDRLVLSPGPCSPAEAGICVASIGHFMGKRVIAQHVQSLPALHTLRELGVDCAQGYALAAPHTLQEVENKALYLLQQLKSI